MTLDIRIYDKAVLKGKSELAVGDLIEACHGSRIDSRLNSKDEFITYSKSDPTGILGIAIGRLTEPRDLENYFKSTQFKHYPVYDSWQTVT